MQGLPDLLGGAEPLEDGIALDIPEDWLQGRTAYGGLTSAIALAAAQRIDGELPPLRSAQLAMIAPLAGRVEARAKILRRGRNATWVAAELTAEKELGFTASFVFMRSIDSVLAIDGYALPQDLTPAEAARAVPMERAPAFLRNHFDVRFALPKSQLGGEADLCWWVRARERDGLDPAVECLLCGDALPTAVLPLLSFSVPISSMHWQVNMLDPAPGEDGWWLLRSTTGFARSGGASEHILQWNGSGKVAASGTQSVAVFG